MGIAANRMAVRRIAGLALAGAATLLAGCETPAGSMTAGAVERAAPRHPIQPFATPVVPAPETISETAEETRRLTPGPNSRVSPTPDMAPRVEPAPRLEVPSSRPAVEDLQRRLQQQRQWQPQEPGPPAGTIDQRPGTIRTTPGTIEVPR